jgi:large subunit ribosomal protein L25
MAAVANLAVEKREQSGKGAARAVRREGKVPGVIYGGKEKELNISIEQRLLVREVLKGSFTSRVFDLEVGGSKIRALPREVQFHPVTDVPEHVDFMRITADSKVHVFVHVNFLNADKAPGIKRGGVLNIVRHEIELICSPEKIPTQLTADLAGLEIGGSIHASHIKLPEGTQYAIKGRDFTVATIAGRQKEEEIATTAPVAAEVPATAQKAPEAAAGAPAAGGKPAAGAKAPAAGAKAPAAPAGGKK